MPDLREQLQQCFQGRVCLLGLGNVDYGDDGFGVRLAEELRAVGISGQVILCGTAPERFISRAAEERFDHVLFLDAVDFGGAPGSVVLLDSHQMAARFPQVSTHKLSLGLLARQVEANCGTKAWLLGVQPESLRQGEELSPRVQATLELLLELLRSCSARSSRGNEALTSLAPQFDRQKDLSLVTSAATGNVEVTA
jgi:hydrogenase maturation protease